MAGNAPDEAISILRVSPSEVLERSIAAGIENAYREVFRHPPYDEPEESAVAFVQRLQNQTGRDGWRLLVAEHDGEVQGFCYGYVSHPGQWWHDRVISVMEPEDVERWYGNSFVLVELAIRLSARGRGAGGRLHEAILADLPQRVALTMTHQDENPAVSFYRYRGWRVVYEGFCFHDRDPRRLILARDLLR